MELRVLKYFLTVADEGNITRAADILHVTQPILSRQLMELEEDMGTALLIRGKRSVTLTDEGFLFKQQAETIVELADKLEHTFTDQKDVICGTIAPPLTAWLKENNMAGKMLLPFFSHCGGEDKGMEQAVRDLCPEAKIGSSLYVLENRRENLQEMVQAWLKQNFPENHS